MGEYKRHSNDFHRRSTRLKGFDYSKGGAYFITICTYGKQYLFGDIVDGEIQLNKLGEIVRDEWLKTAELRNNVFLDQFIVMPDHFHGIIHLRRGTACRALSSEHFGKPVSESIPTIIRSFKSSVTNHINRYRNTPSRYVWQRNFHDHIIRDEIDLMEKRQYIKNNPKAHERARHAVPLHKSHPHDR